MEFHQAISHLNLDIACLRKSGVVKQTLKKYLYIIDYQHF
jgi:hypothetical protein